LVLKEILLFIQGVTPMGTEIERKFLVNGDGWNERIEGTLYRQGYLSTDKHRVVRVRLAGDRGFITIKGISEGASRAEFEYEIPGNEADEMLNTLCIHPLLEKVRHKVEYRGLTWEIDEFAGENRGLVVAEVELSDEAQQVELPVWAGREVTGDPRYFNSNLVKNPYSTWK